MTTLYLTTNFVATGYGHNDRSPGNVLLMNEYNHVLLYRIIYCDKDRMIDPLTPLNGLTSEQLEYGFELENVQKELIQAVQRVGTRNIKIICSNDIDLLRKKHMFGQFVSKIEEEGHVFINFSHLLSTSHEHTELCAVGDRSNMFSAYLKAVRKPSCYFSVKEAGKTLLGIDSPKLFCHVNVTCVIMKEVITILETYGYKYVHDKLIRARKHRLSPYIPLKTFNGICFSKFNTTYCVCGQS